MWNMMLCCMTLPPLVPFSSLFDTIVLLKVTLAGDVFVHDFAPKYLGVNFDRSLTYKNIQKMCAIKLSHAATSSANWQELTGVHQLRYFAHLLLLCLVYIQSQNIVCQCGEDVLMSSTLVPPGHDVVTNPTCPQPGFTLPRRQFVTLNRLRCGQARCAESLYRWGVIASPACPCGESHQTTLLKSAHSLHSLEACDVYMKRVPTQWNGYQNCL